MKELAIYLIGIASVACDQITTYIGLTYPEIKEMNPLANPVLEGVTLLLGQAAIIKIGEKVKANPKLTTTAALIPATLPFTAALRNLCIISIVHAKYYPWEECPILYS